MHLLLFSLLPIHFVRGECPRMDDIPIMIPNYPFDPAPFTCMHFWHDKGADLYLDACNGELLVFFVVSCLYIYDLQIIHRRGIRS